MSDAFGAILKFLGTLLNGIFELVPSYGVAIILLTIVVRIGLFPLAVKQIKSMTAMQKIQPKLKEIQKKHKGDRQKLNEEMMKLYREHGVNPLGGCFPMLLQLPVFIALYLVIRSALIFDAPVVAQEIEIPITKDTLCRPVGDPQGGDDAPPITQVRCTTNGQEQDFDVATGTGNVTQLHAPTKKFDAFPGYVTRCELPGGTEEGGELDAIRCTSPLGTGHLPTGGDLFADLIQDQGTFLGMHLACSPTQATSKTAIQACTTEPGAGGGAPLIGYYGLVLLMAGTTYYQQRQIMSRQQGTPAAQQMQMMAKIMPVFMGFISLNFPAALSLYWVIGNFWMIGQQHFVLKAQQGAAAEGTTGEAPAKGKAKLGESTPKGKPKPAPTGGAKPVSPTGGRPGRNPSRKNRSKKKRRR